MSRNVDLDAAGDVVGFDIDGASRRLDLTTLETIALDKDDKRRVKRVSNLVSSSGRSGERAPIVSVDFEKLSDRLDETLRIMRETAKIAARKR
jgi:hypothetical protein